MKVEVVTPEEFMGDVIGDLNSRRGQVASTEARGNATAIQATIPLANMFGYINNLRSSTQGELNIQCSSVIMIKFLKMFKMK